MEATEKMSFLSVKAVMKAMDLLRNFSEEEAKKVIDLEEEVDAYEDELGAYMVLLSRKDLAVHETQTLSMMLHSIGDFERLSDHAVTISKAAEEMYKKGMKITYILTWTSDNSFPSCGKLDELMAKPDILSLDEVFALFKAKE